MCPGSRTAAALARAGGEQAFEGVDARAMAVAPLHPEPVGADQRDGAGEDGRRPLGRVEDGAPAHLLDTSGAAAGQPERPGGVEGTVTLLVPFDEQTVVLAGDSVGYRRGHWNSGQRAVNG